MTAVESSTIEEITPLRVETPDGRGIAVWRSGPDAPSSPGRVALVAPGFCRRMRHMAATARYLTANGFVVYRCDYLDHVGGSDGDVGDFTLTGMYRTLEATYAHVLAAEDVEGAVVVAASLAARPSVRLAATTGTVRGIVGLVGVVNPRYTLERVFGTDYGARPLEDYGDEEFAQFENRRIKGRRFIASWFGDDWLDAAATVRDISRMSTPIVNYCGSADDWVSLAEVKEVFAHAKGPARVVELPFVEHELSRNLVAGQTLLRETTRSAVEFADEVDPAGIQISEPGFGDLVAQVPYERAVEAAALPTTTDRGIDR